eukprot:GHVS01059176.1.p1 GENE.GHVS01059176.1~~GHVS01059176.1.p1  ORF type:complete len:232 (+),score=74.22 GHVS01059176.1:97-792(+)
MSSTAFIATLLLLLTFDSFFLPTRSLSWERCSSSPPPSSSRASLSSLFTSSSRSTYSSPSSRAANSSSSSRAAPPSPFSSSSSSPISDLSLSLSPDPPVGGRPLSLILSAASSRVLQQPMANISGHFSAFAGLFNVPFSHSIDYCESTRRTAGLTVEPIQQQQQQGEERCPVNAGKWAFEVRYAVPPIPISGKMKLRVEVNDAKRNYNNNSGMGSELICVDIETNIVGGLF